MNQVSEYEVITVPDPESVCDGCIFHEPNSMQRRCTNPYREMRYTKLIKHHKGFGTCESPSVPLIFVLKHRLTEEIVEPTKIVQYFKGDENVKKL